jgi:hypothetical protein
MADGRECRGAGVPDHSGTPARNYSTVTASMYWS